MPITVCTDPHNYVADFDADDAAEPWVEDGVRELQSALKKNSKKVEALRREVDALESQVEMSTKRSVRDVRKAVDSVMKEYIKKISAIDELISVRISQLAALESGASGGDGMGKEYSDATPIVKCVSKEKERAISRRSAKKLVPKKRGVSKR